MSKNKAIIIFPHLLFKNLSMYGKIKKIYIIEEQLFFKDYSQCFNFHKNKLVYHRASLKYYYDFAQKKGYDVEYIEFTQCPEMSYLFDKLKEDKINEINFVELTDLELDKRINDLSSQNKITIVKHKSPSFLCSNKYIYDYFKDKKTLNQTSFYRDQRKKFYILMNKNKPFGQKWTYDKENRKKLPENINVPSIKSFGSNNYVIEACNYINKKFPDNYGKTDDFVYPTTHGEAQDWLNDFLEKRFEHFGDYEDAITDNDNYLFHSVIAFALNTGLLLPNEVIDKVIKFATENKVEINNLEGFIRQILGWREFIHAVYLIKGANQKESNYFNFNKKMPKAFYNGTTGIFPVDTSIKKLLKNAYLHHIERLMILGNFMLLCEVAPNEVYKWFMELFIDSYDWVMTPNIYGMSQYADGGLIVTKPYISSSAYILKMSNYKRDNWCEIWDALYWRFIYKYYDVFDKNPRMHIMTTHINRMSKEKIDNYVNTAEDYLKKL